MKKPGRNEPCHCGSGKKYKNCCQHKDELEAVALLRNNQTDDNIFYPDDDEDDESDFIDEHWMKVDKDDGNEETAIDDEDGDEGDDSDEGDELDVFEDEDENEDATDVPYPTISAEDEALVDAWWDKYRNTDDLDAIQSHLDDFISRRPDLIENLRLQHEMLFELGGQYQREGRYDQYIQFMISFRSHFPAAYARGAGYYDKDIIAWLIGQNRRDEIKSFLSYFIAHPVGFYEQLDDVANLMLATDTVDELSSLLTQVATRLINSRSLYNADRTIEPLVAMAFGRYVKADCTAEDVKQFLHEASMNLPFEIDTTTSAVAWWLQVFHETSRTFAPWPAVMPSRTSERQLVIIAMANNFCRFMKEHVGLSWMSARYYRNILTRFLFEYWKVASNKRNTYSFRFEKIVSTALSLSRDSIFTSVTRHTSFLNALYYFADYLKLCGNLNAEESQDLQEVCNRIYERTKKDNDPDAEAVGFTRFPLFALVT